MRQLYNFAFFDEGSKREIRRAILKGIAIPGYQVPFASREMPIGRGWGTGGLQITLAIIGRDEVLKVIDQGHDGSVNAVNIKKLICATTGVALTEDTAAASLIQSRHRIPEEPLSEQQVLVLQVPTPEPLRDIEAREQVTQRLHAEADYTGAWLGLFEQVVRYGSATTGADHPVLVNGRYVMAPSPIPRLDNHKLDHVANLTLLGAGREKKIYAVPPYTSVKSLDFEDYPFVTETFEGRECRVCGAKGVYFDELVDEASGKTYHQCNDTNYCHKRQLERRQFEEQQSERRQLGTQQPAAQQLGDSDTGAEPLEAQHPEMPLERQQPAAQQPAAQQHEKRQPRLIAPEVTA
ncbi:MAG: alpha-D-ribose 1-methylphosphonate 5-phosphate C-P-lyase PhnJ [Coriobacteriaceae bacterium]|jgi:alpha-D-ribose 1-methylphosphonate 5-phosphate C-P lyase|nr:alpha-D-ribose 1-methylphosphonate 5-phosphate C-P-lyase PhnJ [Coriobacteriaceae bacterium]